MEGDASLDDSRGGRPILTMNADFSGAAGGRRPQVVIASAFAPAARVGTSFRVNYGEHGVDGYYEKFGATYANPHEREIRNALRAALTKWPDVTVQRVLDLACGSG